jgi:hypothetical protein
MHLHAHNDAGNAMGELLATVAETVKEVSRPTIAHVGLDPATSPSIIDGCYKPAMRDGLLVLAPGERLVRLDTGQELTPEEARDLRAER